MNFILELMLNVVESDTTHNVIETINLFEDCLWFVIWMLLFGVLKYIITDIYDRWHFKNRWF